MKAVLRINTFNKARFQQAMSAMQELEHAHADLDGYLGALTVDLGDGRFFVANLWDTDEHRLAGLEQLAPLVERWVNPLLAEPSELIGVGTVVRANAQPQRKA